MVVIRLSRCGAKHKPRYRVTVADSRYSATGRFIEIIGRYNSTEKDKKSAFQVDMEKYKKWVSHGAQPSRTLRSLVRRVYELNDSTPAGKSVGGKSAGSGAFGGLKGNESKGSEAKGSEAKGSESKGHKSNDKTTKERSEGER